MAAAVDVAPGLASSVWIDSFNDPVAGINTLSSLMTLAPIDATGVQKLLVVDLGSRGDVSLKVWEGRSLAQTARIQDVPVGLAAFVVADNTTVPAVAVACGASIFVFRSMKPFYKFTLPPQDTAPQEADLWAQAAQGGAVDLQVFTDTLQQCRDAGTTLTPQSLELLSLPAEQRERFVETYRKVAPVRHSAIVCMSTLYKSVVDVSAPSCLVLATEAGQVLVLSPSNFSVIARVQLPGVPVLLSVSGQFDTEYRVVVACRNGHVYTIKNGKLADGSILLPALPVGLVRTSKCVYVGCMDDTLYCFSTRGKRLWSLLMPAAIMVVEPMNYQLKSFKAVIVTLHNGEVRIYQDRNLIFTFNVGNPVVAASFGKYGADEGVLVLATQGGELIFKTIRRGADFDAFASLSIGPPPEQSVRINIPSKTQLYLDQTQREKDNFVAMHRMFQRDLCSLRLNVARSYLKSLGSAMPTSTTTATLSVKMEAEVRGLGPTFVLVVNIQNTGQLPLAGARIFFACDTSIYALSRNAISAGMLTPGVNYEFTNSVKCVTDELVASDVTVFLKKDSKAVPAITAIVHMPISEPLMNVR